MTYPWIKRILFRNTILQDSLDSTTFLPRSGHSLAIDEDKGIIYLFGGCTAGGVLLNDIYCFDINNCTVTALKATDVPKARFGHISAYMTDKKLLVWGGDTRPTRILGGRDDDTVHILDVTGVRKLRNMEFTRSHRLPRYGHAVARCGMMLFVFGGQFEDGSMSNNLWRLHLPSTFDLSVTYKPIARNEVVEAQGRVPAKRVGHIFVGAGMDLYLFGGTDGHYYYRDTWRFNVHSNQWLELQCVGCIPAARTGHSATVSGDALFVYGGRSVGGKYLDDLAILKISERQWYNFPNTGISVSRRSGHAMTSFKDKIYIIGGVSPHEMTNEDIRLVYVLDTTFIKYVPPIPRMMHGDERLPEQIALILQHKDLYRRLLAVPLPDAQNLLDIFQYFLDDLDLNYCFRANLVVATQRLAAKTGLLPFSYDIKDVLSVDEYPIDSGGSADIYKGHIYGRTVCIKSIRLYQKSQVDHTMKQFAKEAILWAQLSHPNVLAIFGVCKFRGRVSIVSQWMENGNISTYLINHPGAPRPRLALDVVHGLSYIHGIGVIHGDLKSMNILVDDAGRARLTDFGISSVYDSKIIAWTTQSSSRSEGGTIRWQAPELFAVEKSFSDSVTKNTMASDIYSLGCVYFEIFTSEIPFSHIGNEYTVIVAVKDGQRPSRPQPSAPAWMEWGLNEEIWSCMEKCWKADPSSRPTAALVAHHLSTIVQGKDRRETSPEWHDWVLKPGPEAESLSTCP